MGIGMDFGNSNLTNMMSGDNTPMTMYSQAHFNTPMLTSPMASNTSANQSRAVPQGSSGTNLDQRRPQLDKSQSRSSSDTRSQPTPRSHSIPTLNAASQRTPQQQNVAPPQPQRQDSSNSTFSTQTQVQYPQPESRPDSGGSRGRDQAQPDQAKLNPNLDPPWETPEGGWPSTMTGKPHMQSGYKNVYSSTGFDMLGVLVSPSFAPLIDNITSYVLRCV